jgi:hypothetical protein
MQEIQRKRNMKLWTAIFDIKVGSKIFGPRTLNAMEMDFEGSNLDLPRWFENVCGPRFFAK